jgi:hypothetical protein
VAGLGASVRTVGSGVALVLADCIFFCFPSRPQCGRMHDQRRDKRRRRGSAKLWVAAALYHRLRSAGAARASGGRPGRRGRIGAGTGYRAVPAQCHWTARVNSECCGDVRGVGKSCSSNKLRSQGPGRERVRVCGEKGARATTKSPAEQAW